MRRSHWIDLPLTEIETEILTLRFDPDRILTITKIARETGHKNVGGALLRALRKLQARGPGLPPSPEEQELIDLVLSVTAAANLERAYQVRNLQVRRFSQKIKHLKFHGD